MARSVSFGSSSDSTASFGSSFGSSSDSTTCNIIEEQLEIYDASGVYDTFEKPIRVIVLKKTIEEKKGIHFIKPQHWDFHVLSHTWSSAVRKFSKNIGHTIKAFTSQDKDAYNKAFENETFDKDPTCYKQLLAIFEALHADGVNLLWFDALCIDQTSKEEKSYEINNMGSYFSLSIGTYVLTHGVGNVNGIRTTKETSDEDCVHFLPRWFTRVWTFQEFLLPKQLTFLVEGGVDQKFVAMINCLIRERERNGFCKCFLNMQDKELDKIFTRNFKEEDLMWIGGFELRNPKWKSIAQLIRERAPPKCTSSDTIDDQKWSFGLTDYGYQDACKKCDTKTDKKYQRNILPEMIQRSGEIHSNGEVLQAFKSEKSIICGEKTCEECGSKAMIRKAMNILVHEETTYFVDREVFLGLVQCHSRLVEKGPQEALVPSKGIQALRGLYCAWATEGNWRPCHVICEVGWRECKEEEDRVLAILGLLGLHLTQLRTQKSLKHQVLELTKAGGSAMLVELCHMNQKAGSLPGMSWAPEFKGHNLKLEHASRPRHVSMQINRVESDGQLKVRVNIACGRVEPHYTNDQGSQYRLILHNLIHVNEQGHTTKDCGTDLCFSLTRDDEEEERRIILHFDFKQDERTQLCGAFEVPIKKLEDKRVSFAVRLLLLGEDEKGRSLFLICIPDKISSQESKPYDKLHKIGSLSMKPNLMRSTFDPSKFLPCSIGGFGDDLAEYIQFH